MQKTKTNDYPLLSTIKSPQDIQSLSYQQLRMLALEIRAMIISVVGTNGGHLASNLGVVELTIAMHRVFKSPEDAFVWDVGHQVYTHKLLTGRYEQFHSLRTHEGLSGFPKKSESSHDFFDVGHASTSISSALGLLTAKKIMHKKGTVIAVIGDGALTGGLALEGLLNAGQNAKNFIVILNDNKMSIGQNTGALSRYLSSLTMSRSYQLFRNTVDKIVPKIPFIGNSLTDFIFYFKRSLKALFFRDNLFANLGFEYVGPLNGHNITELEKVLQQTKHIHRPIMVHVVTKKGRGYALAENDPATFHGIGPFSISDGSVEKFDTLSFTEAFSHAMLEVAAHNDLLVAITAAMAKGTGLAAFAHRFPHRFFDVGIAEGHAVTFAGGMALAGLKPVVAIYSTFMQRAVDQVIHDVALQNVPIVFALDRSGAVPDDGETHQGLYDIALFRCVPNILIMAPASAYELKLFLLYAVEKHSTQSVIIRYPKAPCPQERIEFKEALITGRGVLLKQTKHPGKQVSCLFICTGGIFPEVHMAQHILEKDDIDADIYNMRFIKPIDEAYLVNLASSYSYIVCVEDGIRIGGIGECIQNILYSAEYTKRIAVCAFPDTFISQGKRLEILAEAGLAPEHLAACMKQLKADCQ